MSLLGCLNIGGFWHSSDHIRSQIYVAWIILDPNDPRWSKHRGILKTAEENLQSLSQYREEHAQVAELTRRAWSKNVENMEEKGETLRFCRNQSYSISFNSSVAVFYSLPKQALGPSTSRNGRRLRCCSCCSIFVYLSESDGSIKVFVWLSNTPQAASSDIHW